MKNRLNANLFTTHSNTLPDLPPAQIAREVPRGDPLEYEVSSWYGPERVERILLNTCIRRVSPLSLPVSFQIDRWIFVERGKPLS